MKRRDFLTTASILGLPVALGGMKVSAITNSSLFNLIEADTDRVLVLVQLNGGNDGLNTLIPLDQYDNLQAVRSNIIVPESSIINVNDTNGFHPQMGAMKTMFDEEKLGIIQSVGYPNQNRSHFRSTDIWTSASSSDEFLSSGWLGRYLDLKFPDYPESYPNDDFPDPFAMTLGYVVSETCQGMSNNFSFALNDESSLIKVDEYEDGDELGGCYGEELAFIKSSIRQANLYVDSVVNAFETGGNQVDYPENNGLADQLRIVANLISGGLQTRIYVVSLGGFDTHAAQVNNGEEINGVHATLLQQMSDAVNAFQKDMELQGLDERVLGMTFSEFGRRIRSNLSNGTDHGTAAPLFVFGSCIQPGILGTNPEISQDVANDEGVPMQYDFRSVYGSILMDWFNVSEEDVKTIIYEDFQHIPFLNPCNAPVSTKEEKVAELVVYPNPAQNYIHLDYESEGNTILISVMDAIGSVVTSPTRRILGKGLQKITLEIHNLKSGAYFIRLQEGSRSITKRFIKA